MKEIEKECEGRCPLCNSDNLDYNTSNIDCDYVIYSYTCETCHTTGKEYYKIIYEITLADVREHFPICHYKN